MIWKSVLGHRLFWGHGVVRCKTGEYGGADDWIIRCVRRTTAGVVYVKGQHFGMRPLNECTSLFWLVSPLAESEALPLYEYREVVESRGLA